MNLEEELISALGEIRIVRKKNKLLKEENKRLKEEGSSEELKKAFFNLKIQIEEAKSIEEELKG